MTSVWSSTTHVVLRTVAALMACYLVALAIPFGSVSNIALPGLVAGLLGGGIGLSRSRRLAIVLGLGALVLCACIRLFIMIISGSPMD